MKRIQEEATTQHEQNSEKLKNAEEKVASLEKQLDAANKVKIKIITFIKNIL